MDYFGGRVNQRGSRLGRPKSGILVKVRRGAVVVQVQVQETSCWILQTAHFSTVPLPLILLLLSTSRSRSSFLCIVLTSLLPTHRVISAFHFSPRATDSSFHGQYCRRSDDLETRCIISVVVSVKSIPLGKAVSCGRPQPRQGLHKSEKNWFIVDPRGERKGQVRSWYYLFTCSAERLA